MGTRMDDIVARVTSQTQYSSLLAGDKFGFLSAKQYDAEGDGATDDSAAILSMLTVASASTYKALYFPAGTYLVDNVTLTSTHFSGYYLFGDNASFSGITQHIEQVGNTVGNLSDLLTSATSSIVGAINELDGESVAGVLTTRGDSITRDSTGTIRVATGTPLQYAVAGNTSDTTPFNYQDSPQKVMTTLGDLLYASTNNTIARQGIGTNLQTLGVNATTDGYSFIDSPQKVMTSTGSMIFASSANNMVELAKPNTSEGRVLQYTTAPSWQVKTNMEVITSTSGYSWTPTRSGSYKVTVTGAGGSGAIPGTGYTYSAGGGGAGGTAIAVLVLSSSETITITNGAGGTAVAASTTPTNGNAGATSSFGAYLTATGGSGGSQADTSGAGGAGGTGTGGDINVTGGVGGSAYNTANDWDTKFAEGGISYFGGFGAYGSGSKSYYEGAGSTQGTNGVCIIEY